MSLTAEQLCKLDSRISAMAPWTRSNWRADVADGHERPDVTRITYRFFHFMQVTRG